MVEDDATRAVFFDPDDFGETVTIKPNAGDEFAIMVIFDERPVIGGALNHAQVGFKGSMHEVGNGPQFRCRTSDIAGVKATKAQVSARGTDYNVWDIKPDGTGVSTVILKVA